MTIVISLEISEPLKCAHPDADEKELAYLAANMLERIGFNVVEINIVEYEENT